jgi:hypothetical protein
MESKKNDKIDNKPRMELLPLYSPAIEELCRVYEAGIESMVEILGRILKMDMTAIKVQCFVTSQLIRAERIEIKKLDACTWRK